MRIYSAVGLTTLLLVSFSAFSQQRKDLVVSVSGGIYNSPYYENNVSGGYYSAGVDYSITSKHVLQMSFTAAEHTYLERAMSNVTANMQIPGYTNAINYDWVIALGYKYRLDFPHFVVLPGAAVGMISKKTTYPYRFPAYESILMYFDTQIVFPVTLEAEYKLGRHWLLGLKSAVMICPDYPILGVGLHAGPVLSYVIK
jgi:hypothetical protein